MVLWRATHTIVIPEIISHQTPPRRSTFHSPDLALEDACSLGLGLQAQGRNTFRRALSPLSLKYWPHWRLCSEMLELRWGSKKSGVPVRLAGGLSSAGILAPLIFPCSGPPVLFTDKPSCQLQKRNVYTFSCSITKQGSEGWIWNWEEI